MKRRSSAAMCVILLLVMGVTAWGQPPARRRAPPANGPAEQQREGRRERLREIGGGLLDNLVKPLLADPKEQTRGLDVSKINTQVASLLASLTAGDTAVEALSLGFDPKLTQIEEDRLALNAALDLRHSAWSHDPSHADVQLQAHLDHEQPGAPQAVLKGLVHVETDVVPLVALALEKARAKLTTESLPPLPTAQQLTKQRLAIVLAEVPPPRDMDDVADLFTLIASEQLPAFVAEIAELKYALEDESLEPEQREELVARLDNSRRQRDRLFETHPRIHRNESGRVEAITIMMEHSEAIDGAHIEQLELEITAHQVHGHFTASMQRGAQAYLLFKPLAIGLLKRFQERDPDLNKQTEGLSRWYYSRARDELVGREF